MELSNVILTVAVLTIDQNNFDASKFVNTDFELEIS